MKLFRILALMLLVLAIVSSCKKSARDVYAEAVEEWIGKEILFPDSMMTVSGEMIAPPTADFTIVSYYDSTGCTGCRMKLPFWNEFMNKMDSLKPSRNVALVMIAGNPDKKELSYLIKRDAFSYPVVMDADGKVNGLNRFPVDNQCNTFLIASDHKVLLIGNPVINRKIGDEYLRIIGDGDTGEPSKGGLITYEHDFGLITPGERASHIFTLKNEIGDTLKVRKIVSSCDCTVGTVSMETIPPKSDYTVTVTFNDTVPGDFYRTVTLFFENQNEIQFELSGEISAK